MAVRELRVLVPVSVFEKLVAIEQKVGVRKEDLILRAIVKVIDEFGGGG
ncbi:MAG: hypothetical protein QXH20_00400 [Candidatus Bathyarchaeia archaeon]